MNAIGSNGPQPAQTLNRPDLHAAQMPAENPAVNDPQTAQAPPAANGAPRADGAVLAGADVAGDVATNPTHDDGGLFDNLWGKVTGGAANLVGDALGGVTDAGKDWVNNLSEGIFDILPGNIDRKGDAGGERVRTWGDMKDRNPRNFIGDVQSRFGRAGETVSRQVWGGEYGKANIDKEGGWGSFFAEGETVVGASARSFKLSDRISRESGFGGEAMIGAQANYHARYQTPDVNIGVARVGGELEGRANAVAGAYAGADGRLRLNFDDGLQAKLGAEAFAGLSGSINGEAALTLNDREFVAARGEAQGWLGLGASANADVGFDDWKLSVDGSLGAALGVGGEVSGGFDVDFRAVGGAVVDGVEAVAEKAFNAVERFGEGLVSIFD